MSPGLRFDLDIPPMTTSSNGPHLIENGFDTIDQDQISSDGLISFSFRTFFKINSIKKRF
jgi:hypothetical protein